MNTEQIEKFVEESNAIERIFIKKGPEWDNHIEAVHMVLRSIGYRQIVHPIKLHTELMENILPDKYIGKYRQTNITIDNDVPPKAISVPYHMEEWENQVNKFISDIPHCSYWQLMQGCWDMHYYFESIHPFIDGNGRTGRLILNNLRLLCGLDWLTIKAAKKENYYEQIRKWKRENFNK